MAYKTGNTGLDQFLTFIEKEFGKNNAGNAARFAEDIKSGRRTLTELRADVLRYQVGQASLEEWVRDAGGSTLGAGKDSSVAARVTRIANELMAGSRTFSDTRAAISQAGGTPVGTSTGGGTTDTKPATLPGALKGGQTIRVRSADGVDRYYQIYEFPAGSGQYASFQYSGLPQVTATLGNAPTITAWTEANYNKKVLAEAQAEEVIGLAGSWTGFTSQIIQDAAAVAGVRDPSLIGKIASNAEMQKIMVQAAVGEWTTAQIKAAQRATSFWKNTLYPGIEAFYGKTTEPEAAWMNYNDTVAPALNALGYARDADGTYNASIKRMLDAKIDADTFNENVPVFQQAVQNTDYFNVLNARSQAELGKSITFGDWFGLLKGEAAPEINKVAEGAMLAYQAQQASTGLDENMLQRLIAERDISENEARNLFSEVNQAVLALGEAGLARGDLTRDDIISAAANISPASGLSTDEVRLKIAKLARENDLFDNEKMNFYVGYNAAGRPVRPGLAPLAPEGA